MKHRRRNPYVADSATRSAKLAGYPARSVYKLEEIDRRVRLFSRGQKVLDLGAAPGSWTLYASQRVGKEGLVVAVDVKPLTKPPLNVRALEADALTLEAQALLTYGPFHVVLSDMAPATTGNRQADHAKSYELWSRAWEVAREVGEPGLAFVGKLFMGPDFEAATSLLKGEFKQTRVIRPRGTRRGSTEVFLVGIGRRDGTASG